MGEDLQRRQIVVPTLDRVAWSPQRGPQTGLVTCPLPDVFYGGARGGGKSDGLIGDFIGHAHRWGRNARGLLLRRSMPELEELLLRCTEILGKIGWVWQASSRTWHAPNGATLKMRFLDTDADASKYQGHQYTWIGVDEAGNFPSPAPIDKLRACLRSAKGVHCVLRLTGNPGGVGHEWLKRRYVLPSPPGKPFFNAETNTWCVFIRSFLKDNRALVDNDPGYVNRLKGAGPVWLVKAWLEGDWTGMVEGSLFKVDLLEFNRSEIKAKDLVRQLGLRPAQYWDFAATKKSVMKMVGAKKDPDFSACATVARDDAQRWWILNMWRKQEEPSFIARKIVTMQNEWQCRVKAEQGILDKTMRGALQLLGESLGDPITIDPIKKGNVDKVTNSLGLQMAINGGFVHLPADCDAWWPELKHELLTFPLDAEGFHDDQVDALSDGINDLRRGQRINDPPKTHSRFRGNLTSDQAEEILRQRDADLEDEDDRPDPRDSRARGDWWRR